MRAAGAITENSRSWPIAAAKEIEYVLDWHRSTCVGPGSVDPPRHVFKVAVEANMATFRAVAAVPDTPNG
jgi:hypothetical protein